MASILGGDLDREDTRFRTALKGDERIALGLSVLSGSQHLGIGGHDWERGKTTMWEAFYLFVDAVLERLHPLALRFPRGQRAIELAQRFEEEYSIP